ncbi:MAG: penicillin-binding protein activator [Alphaproteobacteria bacterium]|nr:penicillin-binding protein activator [Alphaproteobacteria bacterium]
MAEVAPPPQAVAAAPRPAAPQLIPPAAPVTAQPLPPPGSDASVVVDPSALPPPAGAPPGPRGALPAGALATLFGQPAGSIMPAPSAAPVPGAFAGHKTIAVLLPLSGQTAGLGQGMLDAAMLATYEMGVDDVVLRPFDTAGSPEVALQAAQRALAEGAQLLLGPLFAAEAREIGRLIGGSGVNAVAFSNDRSVAGGGVHIMGFLPEAQVMRVIAFARSRQIERFAVLAPRNEYGEAIVGGLQAALAAYGGTLTDVQFYDPGTEDFNPAVRALARYDGRRRAQIQQLQSKNDAASKAELRRLQDQISSEMGFDAVLVAESGARLRALAPLLPYYDIDPAKIKILGTALWDEPGLGNEPALVGAWFAAPPPAPRQEFEKLYEQTFKRRPPRLAALAYDAAALAAVLGRGRGFTADLIEQPSGYAGVDGIFRFRGDGLIERGMAVLEILPRGVKVVDPAPDSFAETN